MAAHAQTKASGLGAFWTILSVALVFVMLNAAAINALAPLRIDLSEGRLYTLSDSSRRIAASVPERITLRLYFSESLAEGVPQLQRVGRRVKELLDAYQRASLIAGGEIVVEVIDPEPFSEAEDEAVEYGIRGAALGPGQSFYFGLVATNATDGREVVPTFTGADESYLEYEISRVIHALSREGPVVVGLMSDLALDGLPPLQNIPPERQRPWQILNVLNDLFDVRRVPSTAAALPADLDVLVVAHAMAPSRSLLYEIDQFVMRGGALIALVDPHAESYIPPDALRNPNALAGADRSSSLGALLRAYGAQTEPNVWVGDLELAQPFAQRDQRTGQVRQFAYMPWLGLGEAQINPDNPITGQLRTINVGAAGVISDGAQVPEGVTRTPLLFTTDGSKLYDVSQLQNFANPESFLDQYQPSGAVRTIAALLEGTIPTAFPEGRPEPAGDETPAPERPGAPEHATQAAEGKIMVVADADLLSDGYWTEIQRNIVGQPVGVRQVADNGNLLINAIESLSGTGDLIGVRGRGVQDRPFTVVEELRADAEQAFRDREQQLEQRLAEAQQRIAELQSQRPEGDTGLLSDAQRQELERLRDDQLDARSELRRVRFELNKDVEALGARIKFINIALVPALVALAAIALGWYRLVRRRADRVRAAGQGARS